MLWVVRCQTGDVRWMARASRLPSGWRARARSDAARRGASGLPAGARRLGVTAVTANNHSPLPCRCNRAADEASLLAETDRSAAPLRPYARAPGDHSSASLVDRRHRIARVSSIRLRRSTVTWSRWVLSDCTEVPMSGLNGKVHATLITRICTNTKEQSRYVMIDTKRFAL